MGRILALDYGLKRIGVAVTDPLQMIASGLRTLPTGEILDFIEAYRREEDVNLVVVGQPRQMDNSPSQLEPAIQAFLKRFKNRFPDLEVVRQDERFTSRMAVQAMVQGGMKKMKRRDKSKIDEISATLILQSYLSRKQP